jgi:predicted transposase/invertase (TIGR01784 family)
MPTKTALLKKKFPKPASYDVDVMPTADIAFKKIFGDAGHEAVALSFLNSLFEHCGLDSIESLDYLPKDQLPDFAGDKSFVIDVFCRDNKGRQFVIEMQKLDKQDFIKRAEYDLACMIKKQLNKGESYYKIEPVVFVGILDYPLFPEEFVENAISHHATVNMQNFSVGQTYSKKGAVKKITHPYQQYIYLELSKFTKTKPEEALDNAERWAMFLKEYGKPEVLERLAKTMPEMHVAIDTMDRHNWTRDERIVYEDTMRAWRDRQSEDATLIAKALNKGFNKGIEKGAEKTKIAIAKEMLADGMSIEKISKVTGLSIEQLEKLS